MQQLFIQHTSGGDTVQQSAAKRLILFFAGWGMDAVPFLNLEKPGYDIMLVYDYNDDSFNVSLLDCYDEICVMAWSLGVWHADRFIAENPQLPFTRVIAVNGTLNPISDTDGIAPRIYDLTSRLPDAAALEKFYRRICGGQEGLERLLPRRPQRDLANLRDELVNIRRRVASQHVTDTARWDEIYLSDSDLIFPFENMRRAWSEAAERVHVMHGKPHVVDFNALIAMAFVDKSLVSDRFASAAVTYEDEARVQRQVAEILVEHARRESGTMTRGANVLEIGSGVGVLTKLYQPLFTDSHIMLWDLSPVAVDAVNGNEVECEAVDAETAISNLPQESVDIIFSSSALQWFNSPRRFVKRLMKILKPGGRAYIAYYVDGTMPETAMVNDAVAMHYPHLDDLLADIEGAEVQSFCRQFEPEFDTPSAALAHVRATGVNSLSRKQLSITDTRRLMKLITSGAGKAVLKFNTQFIIIKKNG